MLAKGSGKDHVNGRIGVQQMERNRLLPNLFNRVVLGVPVVIYIYIYMATLSELDPARSSLVLGAFWAS